MGGMMSGMMGGGAQAAPAPVPMARTVGPGGVSTGNTMGAVAPAPNAFAGGNDGLMGSLFNSILDPDKTATLMANQGISPEDFKQTAAKQNNLSNIIQPSASPREQPAGGKVAEVIAPQADRIPAGGVPAATQQVVQPQPGGIGDILPDLGRLITGGGGGSVGTPQTPAQVQPPSAAGSLVDDLGRLITGEATVGTPAPAGVNPALARQGGTPPPPVVPPMQLPPSMPGVPTPGPAGGGNVFPPQKAAVPAAPAVVPAAAGAAAAPVKSDYVKRLEAGQGGATVMGGAAGAPSAGLSKNPVFNDFIAGVRTKVTNPYGLAAIAATGQHESSFAEKNVFRTWSDPPGKSGGVMSWHEGRYKAMQKFVKEHGGDPNKPSARLQGEFMANEDANLVAQLNAAKSVEEANDIIRKSWKFKGWENTQSGEGARRLATARNFVSMFGGEAGTETTTSTDAGAPAGEEEPTAAERLASISEALEEESGKEDDYRGPPPPGAVAPQGGSNQVDPNVMKLMLLMLSPGGGANIPTLTQLMGGGGNG